MKTLIQAAAVTLFAASAAQAQQAVQWRVEDGGNGHWYVRVAESRTWSGHAAYAASIGAHLVTLTDAPENAFVHGQFPGRAWLGGFTEENQGCNAPAWKWVTGEPWTHAPWAPPEPNYCDETRLEFSGPYPMRWNNYYDAAPNQAIIEWSADCNSDGIVDYGQILDGTLSDVNDDGVPDACQAPCVPSDLNNDGAVDGSDLGALLSDWGPTAGSGTRADINGDGIVNGADLGTLLANWGPCGATPTWATVIQWQPDPSVVTNAQLRAGIQATGLPWRVRDAGTGIELLLVPPGNYFMGASPGDSQASESYREFPRHSVTITQPFYLGRYELTQGEWVAAMESNPSYASTAANWQLHPVEQVSTAGIDHFLAKTALRLPTEAEWEYACRAGTTTSRYREPVSSIAWSRGNSDVKSRPVGLLMPNQLGFHDMLGNVHEWVADAPRTYSDAPQVDPIGTGGFRVHRGGSFLDGDLGELHRASWRSASYGTGNAWSHVGVRVARTP